ncbi:Hypothetical protein A7982_01858 [Minicystis rosea]|nr:Hypothetical protein A7982_01858 [Minicystis rosea]
MVAAATVVSLAAPLAGCVASAKFYSKTSAEYAPLVYRAVRCDEGEVNAVLAAGAMPIGTISARSLAVIATNDDLFEKALRTAGKSGGTHVVLTERGLESFTVTNPGTVEKRCVRNGDMIDCQRTFTPPTQTTYEKPTAKFVVLRVPPERWAALPPALRPAAAP